jgi:hypothetical protein
VPDAIDCCPSDGRDTCPDDPDKDCPGQCGCGVPDTDTDGDGTADCNDGCPNDPNKTEPGDCGCGITEAPDCCPDGDCCPDDPDKIEPGQCGCGVPDTDSDGDNTADCIDGCPDDPDKTAPGVCGCGESDTEDSDGDGTLNCKDGCPNDPEKVIPEACGCGEPETDSDGDGSPDCVDGCPNDHDKTGPGQCGCGEVDTDTDGDTTADCIDGCPEDANKTAPGACGCGVVDTPGCCENGDCCPDDPDKTEPGQCGCGEPDTDTDGDGTADCNDGCPNDPKKTAPGQCGCGEPEDCGIGGGGGDECDPPIVITSVRLPNGFLAVPDIQIFHELGCVAPDQTTCNDVEITYQVRSGCSCSGGGQNTYLELWYEGPFSQSASGQCASRATEGRQIGSALVPGPTSTAQTAVATFTITGTSDFTPTPALVIDFGGGHFYLAVTTGCGEAWYRIPPASLAPLIYNLAFSPAAHTGQPFCPYTHHHDFDPFYVDIHGWYGLDMGYGLSADLTSLAVTISGERMHQGQYGEKQIVLDPANLESSGRRYIKWEGYDDLVAEKASERGGTLVYQELPQGYPGNYSQRTPSPGQQLAPHHVVPEGTYSYAMNAIAEDTTDPGHVLTQRHYFEGLDVRVEYDLLNTDIACARPDR